MNAVLEVLSPGLRASVQDAGRRGWRRFGMPPGGALDADARAAANRLAGNPPDAPVLELLLHGAHLRVLAPVTLAAAGAAAPAGHETCSAWPAAAGEELLWPPPAAGVWSYLAVGGGWAAPEWLGSVSPLPAAGLGAWLKAGDRLAAGPAPARPALGRAWLAPGARPDYARAPALRVWPGPQRDLFAPAVREAFFASAWRVSARSDRAGYRLEGPPLAAPAGIVSEPVLPGSIQVPPGGLPIITLHDGPTVGGYAKLGLVDPADLPWLVQTAPGRRVRFTALEQPPDFPLQPPGRNHRCRPEEPEAAGPRAAPRGGVAGRGPPLRNSA